MTDEEARNYIDKEFELLTAMSVHGSLSTGHLVTFKMMFIAGMAAALGFPGDDGVLKRMLKSSMQDMFAQYGGRTIFPFTDLKQN